jgi:hypothetical protein
MRVATIGGWLMEAEYLYLNRRVTEEREAATHAAHPKARRAHLAMAEYFETRLRVAKTESRRSAVHLVDSTNGANAA